MHEPVAVVLNVIQMPPRYAPFPLSLDLQYRMFQKVFRISGAYVSLPCHIDYLDLPERKRDASTVLDSRT